MSALSGSNKWVAILIQTWKKKHLHIPKLELSNQTHPTKLKPEFKIKIKIKKREKRTQLFATFFFNFCLLCLLTGSVAMASSALSISSSSTLVDAKAPRQSAPASTQCVSLPTLPPPPVPSQTRPWKATTYCESSHLTWWLIHALHTDLVINMVLVFLRSKDGPQCHGYGNRGGSSWSCCNWASRDCQDRARSCKFPHFIDQVAN